MRKCIKVGVLGQSLGMDVVDGLVVVCSLVPCIEDTDAIKHLEEVM